MAQMNDSFDLIYYFGENFVALFLVVGLLLLFRKNSRISFRKRKNILQTVFCVLILIIVETFETYCSFYPSMRNFRVAASVVGYWLRPTVALGFLSLITDLTQRKYILVWIPAIINYFVFFTAFFSPLTFWFDEEYIFQRGPLGYTVFVVSFFYIFLVLVETIKTFRSGKRWRGPTVLVCAVGCVLAPIMEATNKAHYILYPTILASIILYYLYLYSEYLARDVLTELWRRDIFYRDVRRSGSQFSGVIIADMNGLRELNDTKGHQAGDAALICIAKFFRELENESVWAYRMGGDEFALLCIKQPEETVLELTAKLKEKAEAAGFSIAVGYAMRQGAAEIDDVLVEANKYMYSDKNHHYKASKYVGLRF